jgi:pyruvate-formate lyase-activating enzyme
MKDLMRLERKMNKIARVIITTECNLACSYCCNKLPEIQESFKMTTFDEFIKMDFDIFNISGGEPMLNINKLLRLLTELNKKECKIYLYTNGLITDRINEIAPLIDGVNIGAHSNQHFAALGAEQWKKYIRNVRYHVQENKLENDVRERLNENNISIKEWKLNECNNTKEERFII